MRRHWIDSCLKSLQESSIPITPIIVDNGSTDGTRSYIPANYPDIIWLPQDTNIGFGQGNNVGIRYAMKEKADYILLLNQDARIGRDALKDMLDVSDGKSLISPLHLNGEGTGLDKMFKVTLHLSGENLWDDLLVTKQLKSCYEIGEVAAACWLMPIALIEKIGGFNPIFFHYGEDNNYYQRKVYHHVKTLLATKAVMFHDRNKHGNATLYYKGKLRKDMLLLACDIRKSVPRIVAEFIRLLLLSYVSRLTKHQYRIGSYTYDLLWIISKYKAISHSRKIERKEGPTWIR